MNESPAGQPRMHILYLALDVDVGTSTGEATHVVHIVRSLSKLGHEIVLVLPDTEANRGIGPSLESDRLNVEYVPPGSTFRQVLRALNLSKDLTFDVVYERRFNPKVAAAVSFLRRIPFVVEVNAVTPVDSEIYRRASVRFAGPRSWWHSFFLRRARAVVVVTEGLAEALLEHYRIVRSRIVVLPNAADPDLFRPLDPQDCRRRLHLPETVNLVCFIGDLAPWYSLDTVLMALALLRRRGVDVHLVLVGDGVSGRDLKALANQLEVDYLVHWAGRVPHESVPLYVGAADIALAPTAPIERKTRVGSSALKIFEYLAGGRAVITTEVFAKSQPDLEPVLVLVPPADAASLAHTMQRLLGDSAERHRLGSEGRRLIVERYSWDALARRLETLLTSVRTARQG